MGEQRVAIFLMLILSFMLVSIPQIELMKAQDSISLERMEVLRERIRFNEMVISIP
jgi:hypothetical protein